MPDLVDIKRSEDLNIDENSLVISIGGYGGTWNSEIFNKYKCNTIIFEPIKEYATFLSTLFKNEPKVKILNYAILNENKEGYINVNKDASSMYGDSEQKEKIIIKDVKTVIEEEKIELCDVLDINCEGSEYTILNRLVETGLISKFRILLVQFHKVVPNYFMEREKLTDKLKYTHSRKWSFDFVWERWDLIK
jgi:FkbM family methyltransferase